MNKFSVSLNLTDLLEIQKTSFIYFLAKSLKKTLVTLPFNFIWNELEINLFHQELKFIVPKINFEDLVSLNNFNISIGILIPLTIKDKLKGNKIETSLLLGNLPLLLEDGSFLIGGLRKILCQQFISEHFINIDEISSEFFRIISININGRENSGIKIELIKYNYEHENKYFTPNDSEFLLNIEELLNNSISITFAEKKIPLFLFLLLYDITLSDLDKFIKDKYWLNKNFKELKQLNKKQCLNLISIIFNLKNNTELNYFLTEFSFIDKEIRYNLNNKLNLNLNNPFLTKLDFIKIVEKLYLLDNYLEEVDDLDDLSNKKLISCGDYFKEICNVVVNEFTDIIESDSIKEFFNNFYIKFFEDKFTEDYIYKNPFSDVFDAKILEFLSISDNSLVKEDTNLLTSISQQRKIMNNQEDSENITLETRDIHPSFFSKICPIETPEGESSGLISTLTSLSLVNLYGHLCSNVIFNNNNKLSIQNNTTYINSTIENLNSIVLPCSVTNLTKFNNSRQNIIYNKNNFSNKLARNKKQLNFLTPLQFFSASCLLIPFLEHNDANRVLMGSNMQRQAVPLLSIEKPNICTGIEIITASSAESIKALSEGMVVFVNKDKIIIQDKDKQRISYNLQKGLNTQSGTVIQHTSLVWVGEYVYCGQIIANGYSINEAELSLGKNLNVAYISWEGYNFEDSIIISERLVLEDILTSLHIDVIEFELDNSKLIKKKIGGNYNSKSYSQLDPFGVCRIGSNLTKGDILLNVFSPKKSLVKIKKIIREKKKYKIELNSSNYKYRTMYKHDPLLTTTDGHLIDIRIKFPAIEPRENKIVEDKINVKFYIANKRKIKIGDKLSGRFGNKGVISKILPHEDMPFFNDGTTIDIILNPLGIPSRMNIGQIFECLLGLCSTKLNKRFKILSFDEDIVKESTRIFVNNKLKEAFIKEDDLGLFDHKNFGKLFLRDGRTGEFFDNPVLAGNSYILKLFHLVDEKLHSRNIGPYSLITKQPTRGKPKHGGQRFGEMETWALEAYGASFALHEILTIKSDDQWSNDRTISNIYNDKIQSMGLLPESIYTLKNDLNSLGIDFKFSKLNLVNFLNSEPLNHNLELINRFEYISILDDKLNKIKKELNLAKKKK